MFFIRQRKFWTKLLWNQLHPMKIYYLSKNKYRQQTTKEKTIGSIYFLKKTTTKFHLFCIVLFSMCQYHYPKDQMHKHLVFLFVTVKNKKRHFHWLFSPIRSCLISFIRKRVELVNSLVFRLNALKWNMINLLKSFSSRWVYGVINIDQRHLINLIINWSKLFFFKP